MTGVIFGNIHLADIRAWFEEQTGQHKLEHVEPLWNDDPENLVQEFLDRGYVSTIAGIDLSRADPSWLGTTFDQNFIRKVREAPDVDLCGERGEYHSFVWHGPLFRWDVDLDVLGEGEADGHRYLRMGSWTAET